MAKKAKKASKPAAKAMDCSCCSMGGSGLLLLRLVVGAIFLFAGIMKLSNISGTAGFFASLGLGLWLVWVVAILETLGGASMVLGVWTKVSGTILAVIMLVVLVYVKLIAGGQGWNGIQFDLLLLVAIVSIVLNGAGKWALADNCCCSCHK